MSKLIEDLKAAGWVETTLGECQKGEEVLLTPAGLCPRAMRVTKPVERRRGKRPFVSTSDGFARKTTTPVLRAPRPERPEYAPGTVALIRWSEDKPHVRAWKVPGQWILPGGIPLDDDVVEVVRVLLPADQDTPAVEVTDEMVERGAEALYRQEFGSGWDEDPWEDEKDKFRQAARAALEAAMGVQK